MLIKSKILLLIVFLVNGLVFNRTSHSIYIIDLIGTWEGENNSFSSEDSGPAMYYSINHQKIIDFYR